MLVKLEIRLIQFMREIGKKTIQLSVTKRETERKKLPATT
jgi:hypothetical protein